MSGPTKEDKANPGELWEKLSQRPRPTTTIPFPGPPGEEPPGELKLWVLTESELADARANANTFAKDMVKKSGGPLEGDLGYEDIYRNELSVQLVWLCARDVENPMMPAFISPKLVRQKLTTDEIAGIANAYTQFRYERGPFISELSEFEMEAWIKVLKEGAGRVPLSRLSGEGLIDLVMYLVSKTGTPTGSGSAGSPPDASSTNEQNVASAEELANDAPPLADKDLL